MPQFRLETNVPKNLITDEFLNVTSALLATTLDKPESVSIENSFFKYKVS